MISMIQFVPKSALGRRLMDHRIEVLEVATRHRASNLRVFGSVARGDDGPTSDIDLLVDLDDPTNLINVIGLECDLEDVLGIKVDVGALESLRTPLREEVMSEARAL
ncbi:MAG: nucleotidyltransferase family protein [Ferrimicrobium acidiphilum]